MAHFGASALSGFEFAVSIDSEIGGLHADYVGIGKGTADEVDAAVPAEALIDDGAVQLFGVFLFGRLALFYSVVWIIFVTLIGEKCFDKVMKNQ